MAPDYIGKDATIIVVDDPTGCVVPSDGVRIIGHIAHRHAARVLIGAGDGTFNRIADADMSLAINSPKAWERTMRKRELERSPYHAETDRNARRIARKRKPAGVKGLR